MVSCGLGSSRCTNSRTSCSPCAPMNASTGWPSLNPTTIGIDCTRNAWAIPGFSSMSTLTSTALPPVSPTTFSRIGASVLHGPHHGAHRSTTTAAVAERSMTSVWKVASVTSMAMRKPYRGRAWHDPRYPAERERRQPPVAGPSARTDRSGAGRHAHRLDRRRWCSARRRRGDRDRVRHAARSPSSTTTCTSTSGPGVPRWSCARGSTACSHWERITVAVGRDQTGHDLVLLTGPEPDMAWHRFTRTVGELAVRARGPPDGPSRRLPVRRPAHPVGPTVGQQPVPGRAGEGVVPAQLDRRPRRRRRLARTGVPRARHPVARHLGPGSALHLVDVVPGRQRGVARGPARGDRCRDRRHRTAQRGDRAGPPTRRTGRRQR